MRWVRDSTGEWRCRAWWLVAANTILRLFQPQYRKLLVYVRCNLVEGSDEPPTVTGWGIGMIQHTERCWPWGGLR